MAVFPPSTFTTRTGRPGVIRCAEWTDAARLIEHAVHMYDTASEFGVGKPDPDGLVVTEVVKSIETRRTHPDQLFLVAEVDGVFAGEIDFRGQNIDRMRQHGRLGISVAAPFRDQGVGRALIAALLAWAEAHPIIERVCLGVFAHNHRAIALYKAMGFVEDHRRFAEFKFNHGVYVDDVRMSRRVKPPPA